MADLHRVVPEECGLGDLGRPDGFLERQVRGCRKRWDPAAAEGSDPQALELGERLAAPLPESGRPAVLRNDFKIDNCQFAQGPRHRDLGIDWDMATLGDPLVDLRTLLNYWPDPVLGDTVNQLYGGRLENLLKNPTVLSILNDKPDGWTGLIYLWIRLYRAGYEGRRFPDCIIGRR